MHNARWMLVPLLLATGTAAAFGQGWNPVTSMTSPRFGHRAEVVAEYLYVLGGHEADDVATVEALNTLTGVWSPRQSLSTPRNYAASASIGGVIYVAGGYSPGASLQASAVKYDPPTNTWTTIQPMPIANAAIASAVWGDKLYVFGGDAAMTATYVYDPATDQWSSRAAVPHARKHAGAAMLGGLIYVVGGWALPVGTGNPIRSVDIYNPAMDTWTPGPDLPAALGALAVVAYGGRVWAIGGENAVGQSLATVYTYQPGDPGWSAAPSLPAPVELAAVAAGACAYVVGGLNASGPVASVSRLCSPARQLPVLLIPGYCGGADNFTDQGIPATGVVHRTVPYIELEDMGDGATKLGDVLKHRGLQRVFALDPNFGVIRGASRPDGILAEQLRSVIDELLAATNGTQINLVAHSRGGLIARALLESDPSYSEKVPDLVMLGTPHHGSELAVGPPGGWCRGFFQALTKWVCGQAAIEGLVPGSDFLNALNYDSPGDYDSYAQSTCRPHATEQLAAYTAYWNLLGTGGTCGTVAQYVERGCAALCGDNDGIVTVASGKLAPAPQVHNLTDVEVDASGPRAVHAVGPLTLCFNRVELLKHAGFADVAYRVLTGQPATTTAASLATASAPGRDMGETRSASVGVVGRWGAGVSIAFELPRAGSTEVGLFDLLGRRVVTARLGTLQAGAHVYRWDGYGEDAGVMPAGVYFCEIRSGEVRIERRVVMLQ